MMTPGNDKSDEPNDSEQNTEPSRKGEYIITAKDAGWLRPGIFVAPATFITLDPPVPRNRRAKE
jgi:hypothetical protein